MTTIREQLSSDVCGFRQPIKVISTDDTYTASVMESGTMFVFSKADGIVLTLPTSADVGTYFDIMVATTLTSNVYQVITATPASELLVGQVISCATDNSNATTAYPALVGSSYVSVDMDGTTQGGTKGDFLRFVKINSTTWECTGNINASGSVATPFETA